MTKSVFAVWRFYFRDTSVYLSDLLDRFPLEQDTLVT